MPERLLLVRHGLSTWNEENRWQGWADCPLSEIGEAQAAEAAARLGSAGLTGVAASDLGRARRTAEIISAKLGLGEVLPEPGLREYDVGDWEGHTRDEIAAGWPELYDDWRAGHRTQLPGGERRHVFEERVIASVGRLAATESLGSSPLVVTHGGCIRVIERYLGADTVAVPNLSGRWVEIDTDLMRSNRRDSGSFGSNHSDLSATNGAGHGALSAGERVVLLDGVADARRAPD
ncbi:MAG: histidine phosphatase family protein [Actinomycetota bacterium]|nr:histidine phosphatase family protein [Actinomycetota bacterium]